MSELIVNGGRPLSGAISVSGSKNAALPIIFATVVTGGVSLIENLPDIGDVRIALEIIEGLGARISRDGAVTIIDTEHLEYTRPSLADVSRIRASTYLIGACLSRFGVCDEMAFGGCNFSSRPIDLHISAAEALGARLENGRFYAKSLVGGAIDFPIPSVGATVNALLMGVAAKGDTVIRGFACEPHIESLLEFLLSAGADITRSDSEIIIRGRDLHGGRIRIPGDMIEAGTYLALGALSRRGVSVSGVDARELSAVLEVLFALGSEISSDHGNITVRQGEKMRYAELVASPYPGFPTDLQPVFSVPMHVAGGKMTDTVWTSRFGYLDALSRFGLIYRKENTSAHIHPSQLRCSTVRAPDLRGGMACVMAALLADGKSVIESFETVERGYESLAMKLCALGADVRAIKK